MVAMSKLTKSFIESHTSSIPSVPKEWDVYGGHYYYYQLSFRMCQLRNLKYEFDWGDESDPASNPASITHQPSRILVLDLSLNDLSTLDHVGLAPLKQLRVINASFNHIENYVGVEVVRYLHKLDLSHNKIRHIMGIQNCSHLAELNLAMNEIYDISYLPSLTNLHILHLNNNKLTSLEGIQALPALRELYIQRNQIDSIIPLTTSLRLSVLNAADNKISSMQTTLEILKGLRKLKILLLFGNPIDQNLDYQSKLTNSLTLTNLDNVSIQSLKRPQWSSSDGSSLNKMKNEARRAFEDHIKAIKASVDENILFLQKRIVNLQDEYRQFEMRMDFDLDQCIRFMDAVPINEAEKCDYNFIRERLATTGPKPWYEIKTEETNPIPLQVEPSRKEPNHRSVTPSDLGSVSLPPISSPQPSINNTQRRQAKRSKDDESKDPGLRELERWRKEKHKEWDNWNYMFSPRGRKVREKPDYSDVKETDEVLRFAYNELCKEKRGLYGPMV